MIKNSEELGNRVRIRRKSVGITQQMLALTSGTGIRFIIDLEKGKSTCQIGKILLVLNALGLQFTLKSR